MQRTAAFLALIAIIGMSLTIKSSAQTVMDGSDRRIGVESQEKLFRTLRSRLNDPFTSQLIDLEMGREGRVCGRINAKNSFGGYIGFQYFAFDPADSTFTQLIELKNFNAASSDAQRQINQAKSALSYVSSSCPHLSQK